VILIFFRRIFEWLSLFDPMLLALALTICAGGSYTVFVCITRALQAQGRLRWFWLTAVCLCFDADVWAAHFIAMLAYLPALPFAYDPEGIFGSFCIATIGCGASLAYFMWRPGGGFTAIVSGLCFGLTIALTHLIGIGAMNDGSSSSKPVHNLAGIAIAILFSGLAVRAFQARRRLFNVVLAAFFHSVAVFGLFFAAMSGFSVGLAGRHPYTAGLSRGLLDTLVNTESIALAIASASGIVLIATLSAAMADRRIGVLQAQEADKLRDQMRHDGTTGLPNRLFLGERLQQAMAATMADRGFAVLTLDLDNFMPVNDLYGRDAGDDLLRQVAGRLRTLLGPSDFAARIGGDKFALLRYATELPGGAVAFAEQLIRALQEPFTVAGDRVAIGASVGIAVNAAADAAEGVTPETLLQNAETALHDARKQGGGQSCLFKPEMRSRKEARRQLEHDFRHAIEAREFIIYYQPLFEANNLALSGFEALVRWQHPVRGMVSPAEFIPFAEKSGLITALGLLVLETACMEAKAWPEHMRISVNISPVQLRVGDLVNVVGAVLLRTGLPANRLELEVTEGALIEDPEQARSILSRLKDMGVQVTIDDFGTGYSSLSYLRHFPFDRIKIDRSFIQHLEGDADALAIVRAIINLGHSLRVQVLAEGVETPGQLQLLRRQGCDQLQGYLLGRPAPISDATALTAQAVPYGPERPAPKRAENAELARRAAASQL
jgi:diguanylate cyclase (GGDEF)-like protein